MKSGTLLWLTLSLTVGIVNVPNVVSGQTYRQYSRRDDTNDNRWDQWRTQGTIGVCPARHLVFGRQSGYACRDCFIPEGDSKRPTNVAIRPA